MATLRTVKSKGGDIYYVDYMYRGKRYRKSTGTNDRKLAELFLKDIEVKVAKDNFGFDHKFKKRIQFSKATKATNTTLLDEWVLRLFESHVGTTAYLDGITVGEIEAYRIKRLDFVKPTSVNIEIKHLKSAFETSVKWGHIEKNPFREVKLLRIKDSNLPKFFTKEEIKVLLDTIPEGSFKILIYFYLFTGCRRNEALNLDWKDLDLEGKKVTFRETKAGKNRIVPFNGILSAKLHFLDRQYDRPFPYCSDFVTHKFKKYLRASGLENKEVLNVHSLRHTYASHLVMQGVDLLTVSKLLGHSSVKVTEMYAHLVPDHLRASVERLQY